MKSILVLGSLLLADAVSAGTASASKFNPIENMFQPLGHSQSERENDTTTAKHNFQIYHGPDPNAPTPEEREAARLARRERNRERRRKVAEAMGKARPDTSKIEKLSDEEVRKLSEDHPNEFRKLWGSSKGSSKNLIAYADPGDDYDMWQQAYRMLGGFIDCDHQKREGSGDQGGGGSGDNGNQACSRWMMWASVSQSARFRRVLNHWRSSIRRCTLRQ